MSTTKTKPGNRKGKPATTKQTEALNAGRKAGYKVRKERAERRAAVEKPRWKQLEDGDIKLADLSKEELEKGTTANNDGTWEGRRHTFSASWIKRIDSERRQRNVKRVQGMVDAALDAIAEIIDDDDARAQQLQASRMVLEYDIGKVPDVVHNIIDTQWDALSQTGFRIDRGEGNVVVEGEVLDDQGDAATS